MKLSITPLTLLVLTSAIFACLAVEQQSLDPLTQWSSSIDEADLIREERSQISVLSPPEGSTHPPPPSPPPKNSPPPPKNSPPPPKKSPPPPKKSPPPPKKSPPPPKKSPSKKSPPPKKKSPPPPKKSPPPKKKSPPPSPKRSPPPPRTPSPPFVTPPSVPPPPTGTACHKNMYNPCGHGLCIDNGSLQDYDCACPVMFQRTKFASTGEPTCGPIPYTSSFNSKYTLQVSTTCSNLAALHRVTLTSFKNSNPSLNCNSPVPKGTSITAKKPNKYCALYYTSSPGDTCESIASLFGISTTKFKERNPGLDCSNLADGIPVCSQEGSKYSISYCKTYFRVYATDKCAVDLLPQVASIRNLFDLNPGLECDKLGVNSSLICKASIASTSLLKCKNKYIVKPGDTCGSIVLSKFGNVEAKLRKANLGYFCKDEFLIVGTRICY